jgi:heme/copper-type cytochrome/quinol oxidase subunit 3
VKKLITFLSVGYAVYALLIGLFVASVLLRVHDAQVASGEAVSGLQLVPLITLSVITAIFIILFASLAVLLARRRARRTSLVIAGISCLGIPIGTILGGLTIYALTRPDVISEFTPTA